MKSTNKIQYKFLFLIIAVAAIFGLSTNNVYATETEVSEGFCDCSTTGDLICHVPPGNRKNMHTIQVGEPAIDAHLAHGDMLGACPGEEYENDEHHNPHDSVENTCICEDGNIGRLYHVPVNLPSPDRHLRSVPGQ